MHKLDLLTDRRLLDPKPSARTVSDGRFTVWGNSIIGKKDKFLSHKAHLAYNFSLKKYLFLFLRDPPIFYNGLFGQWTVIPPSEQ